MITIKCRACGGKYKQDESVITEEYIQCPLCAVQTKNPLYDGN